MMLMLQQFLLFIAPKLVLTENSALIIAGYNNVTGNSQSTRNKTDTAPRNPPHERPPFMIILFQRTWLAVAHHSRRFDKLDLKKKHRQNNKFEITREDASAWRRLSFIRPTDGQRIATAGANFSKTAVTTSVKRTATG